MKTAAVTLVLMLVASTVSAADTSWTKTDTAMQIAFSVLLELDREQTKWISHHRNDQNECAARAMSRRGGGTANCTSHVEHNPIIGDRASDTRINAYFASVAVGHAAVSYLLRKTGAEIVGVPLVTVWQSVSIGIQMTPVVRNFSAGIHLDF